MDKKVSFDTHAIIDAVLSLETLHYLWDKYKYHTLIISSKVQWEAINRLQKPPYNYSNDQAKEAVNEVILSLNLLRRFKETIDEEEGKALIKKYAGSDANLHYPDSTIIAHMKRIGIDVVVCRDHNFKKVAEMEGLEVQYIPTHEAILDRKVRRLYRGRR